MSSCVRDCACDPPSSGLADRSAEEVKLKGNYRRFLTAYSTFSCHYRLRFSGTCSCSVQIALITRPFEWVGGDRAVLELD